MVNNEEDIQDAALQGLVTRHVFLDTEIYHRYRYDLRSAPLRAMAGHIRDDRIALHITDVTLSEIERHFGDEVTKLDHDVNKFNKQLDLWRLRGATRDVPDNIAIDIGALGRTASRHFRATLRNIYDVQEHAAAEASAGPVFESYFQRRPPFDDAKSKEFPDAFVIAALEEWCAQSRSTMYVVTADNAMRRAAEESDPLIPVAELTELLSIVNAAETPEIVEIMERLLHSRPFVEPLQNFIEERIGQIGMIYTGELTEGEIEENADLGNLSMEGFSVLSTSPEEISVLVSARVPILVRISYEDYSDAIYDREDGRYFGAETRHTEIEDEPTIRLAVTIDREDETVQDLEFITQEIYVSEPADPYG